MGKEIRDLETFSYIAIGKDGKEKKGSMAAQSSENVIVALKADGFIPLSVSAQSFLSKDVNITFGALVKVKDLSLFCRQITGIINAGVSIIEALEIIAEQTANKYLKKALLDTQVAVEKGESLADAMRQQGKIFPPILINMVDAGEASGSLEIAFERMATQFEKEAKIKAMVKKAMIYPCIVGMVSIGVIIVMMTIVIPNFESLFAQMDAELPAITKVVRNMSHFLIDSWYILVVVVGALIASFILYKKTPAGQLQLAKLALKVPVFGNLNVKSYSTRYARTISTLLAAGISLIDALEITAKTIDNVVIRQALLNARDEVARGVPLSVPLKASGVFPSMVCHMTKIGEETGNIEGMLTRLADYYDEEVEMATQSLTAAIEPFVILFLAGIVCLLIAAIMSPMMSMYDAMDKI